MISNSNKEKKNNDGTRAIEVIARGEDYLPQERRRTRGANSSSPMREEEKEEPMNQICLRP